MNVSVRNKASFIGFIVALTRPGYVWQVKMLNQHCWYPFTCVPAAGHSGWQAGEQNASSCRQGHAIDEQSSIYHDSRIYDSAEVKCQNGKVSLNGGCLYLAALDHLLRMLTWERIGKEIITWAEQLCQPRYQAQPPDPLACFMLPNSTIVGSMKVRSKLHVVFFFLGIQVLTY